jgi:hypothetical protein
MKHSKSLFVCCLFLIFSSTTTNAQYFSGEYFNQTAILRSDIPAKSVLLSNLLADSVGDMSPVICSANWIESGKQLECRSLLKFNYTFLPEIIIDDPSLIISAELILYPLQMVFSQTDIDKPARFVVRRVAENWEDTATTWQHQPTADSSLQVNKFIKVKNKNDIVSIDVTKLVLKMLRKGNNGFLISQEDTDQESLASGQFFASPKFGFEELRPLLVINYRRMLDPSIAFRYWNDMNPGGRINNYRGMQPQSQSYPVMEPVRAPDNAPTPQPITTHPIKD